MTTEYFSHHLKLVNARNTMTGCVVVYVLIGSKLISYQPTQQKLQFPAFQKTTAWFLAIFATFFS